MKLTASALVSLVIAALGAALTPGGFIVVAGIVAILMTTGIEAYCKWSAEDMVQPA